MFMGRSSDVILVFIYKAHKPKRRRGGAVGAVCRKNCIHMSFVAKNVTTDQTNHTLEHLFLKHNCHFWGVSNQIDLEIKYKWTLLIFEGKFRQRNSSKKRKCIVPKCKCV